VIIIDVAIENRTGFDFIVELRKDKKTKNTPIVVITQLGDRESIRLALEKGANDYLTKPVDMASLLKALKVEPVSTVTEIPEEVMSPERLEWEHIQHVLHSNNGNVSMTARQLNMHRRTLQRKLQKKPVQQ